MITNRNNTIMAPAYTSTCSTAMNWASSSTNSAASENNVTTSHRALATGLRRVMQDSALTMARPANAQKMISVPATLFPLRVGRVPEARHSMGLGAQPLEIVDESVARILGILVVHAHVDRFLRAHLLAVAAEYAAELVDLVDQRIAVPVLVFAGHELDAIRGTDLRAQPARHALGPSLLVGQHAVGAAPARGQRPLVGGLLLGILHRHLGPPKVAERQRHPLQGSTQIRGFRSRSLHDFDADCHQARPPCSAMDPATMWPRSSQKSSGTASSTFKPNSVSAKRESYVQPIRSCSNQIALAITVT